jgi:hypothetical protein
MSFKDQTSSFFDELTKIVDKQKEVREEGMEVGGDRPFSSTLTQDEEPTQAYDQSEAEVEPDVVTRR